MHIMIGGFFGGALLISIANFAIPVFLYERRG